MRSAITQAMTATHETIGKALADEALAANLEKAAKSCLQVLAAGGKILLAGNGGSAADAQHIAAELVSRFNYDRPGLAAVAITTDTSALSAIGNDYGYERSFARQIEAIGRRGDLFIAISTSGNSPNILRALEAARAKGIFCVGLAGESGGKMAALCDIALKAPSAQTPRIQECHIMLGHILCQLIEDDLFAAEYKPK